MFNNNFFNNNSIPPNYYPNDNNFYSENETNKKQTINIEKLIPLLSGNVNPMDILKNITNSNPYINQILSFLNNEKKIPKKTTTLKSDCNYILVKDYYNNNEN